MPGLLTFENVTGVDISSTMIAKANEIKRHENVTFLLNKNEDLQTIESDTFDFVYSNKTIQHIPYAASKNYIKDFIRILKPEESPFFSFTTASILKKNPSASSGQSGAEGTCGHSSKNYAETRPFRSILSLNSTSNPT